MAEPEKIGEIFAGDHSIYLVDYRDETVTYFHSASFAILKMRAEKGVKIEDGPALMKEMEQF